VTASVETTGSLSRQADIANLATGAAVFGKAGLLIGSLAPDKKVDTRELYLHVRGKQHWVAKVHPDKGEMARKFAAAVNTAAGRVPAPARPASAPAPRPAAAPAPRASAAAAPPRDIAAQLKELSDLRASGSLSEEEYQLAKVRALRS